MHGDNQMTMLCHNSYDDIMMIVRITCASEFASTVQANIIHDHNDMMTSCNGTMIKIPAQWVCYYGASQCI